MVGLEKFIGFGSGQVNDGWTGKVDMFTCSGPRTNVLATSSVPKFLLVSRIGSLKFNSKVMKKMFKILICQKVKINESQF